MKKITVVTTTRRPDKYEKFVENTIKTVGKPIEGFIGFCNDIGLKPLYKKIEHENPMVKMIYAPDNYIFKNGFAKTYNMLLKQVKTELAWMLFDVDEVIIEDYDKFIEILGSFHNYYGIRTHMKRGDSWEDKFQLFDPNVIRWDGYVHENQIGMGELKSIIFPDNVIKVIHNNIVDTESANLEKTEDGFIILKKTEEGTDSDRRNLLYEGLTYRIVHENLHHKFRGWFLKHYEINKEVIDEYYKRAVQKWGNPK